jgi:hypothetical protein
MTLRPGRSLWTFWRSQALKSRTAATGTLEDGQTCGECGGPLPAREAREKHS